PLFANVDELEWKGPTAAFTNWATRIDDKRLLARAEAALGVRDGRPAVTHYEDRPVNESAPPN
ncbi:MAG TPA: hypothetical protein VF836_11885, partial [Gemmatimonadaceae bacterium]